MHFQKQIKISLTLGVALFSSTVGYASSGFENTVNTQLGNGASVSCNACHNGATNASTATLPMANTYKAARTANNFALIATSDSDSDGYINKYEVNAAAVEFNDSAITPFTKATAANTDTNVKALADKNVVAATFTDSTTAPLIASGKQALGGIKVTVNQADSIYFKSGGIDSAATIYAVDATGAGTALTTTTDWTVNTDGSLNLKALPAGKNFPADLVVIQSGTTTAATTVTGGATVTGCLTNNMAVPMSLLLALMGFAMLARRKNF